MQKKDFGSGYFGEWITDEFGQPAYRYTCRQDVDPVAVTPVNKSWREPTEHLHQVGNDRLVALVSNYGYVQVRQDEGAPKLLNDYHPPEKQFGGGFGYLVGGEEVLSTFYSGNGGSLERIFGTGYFRKEAESTNFRVQQTIYAPFGDEPLLLSWVVVTNKSNQPAELRWIEYWGSRIYQLSFRALLMSPLKGGFDQAASLRRRFNQAYQYRVRPVNGMRGLCTEITFKGWSEEEKNEWETMKTLLASVAGRGMAGAVSEPPLPEVQFDDLAPPPIFLVSLDAPADGVETDAHRFFGTGGPANPAGLHRPFSTALAEGVEGDAMLLERRFKLEPGTSKELCFAYGYLPQGFDLEQIITAYSQRWPQLFQETGQAWTKDRLLFTVPGEPWVERELKWHNYYLRSNLTYDSFFQEHILSQGGVYQYIFGFQGAARDPLQHALPFIFCQPWVVREIIRYTLKEIQPSGEIPYGIVGHGVIMPAAFLPSDLELWLLWLAGEYVLATRDLKFLEEKVRTYPADGAWPEPESIKELLWRCYRHLLEKTGKGKHGLLRLSNGDWNDSAVIGHVPDDQHATVREHGESVLNSAMAAYVFDLYQRMLRYAGEEQRAEEVAQEAKAQREAVLAQWNGRWFKRAWLGPGLEWIGEEEMWLEPQPWAIIGRSAGGEQAEKLLVSIEEGARRPSPIGAMLHDRPVESLEKKGAGVPRGILVHAGIWYSINGTLIWALSLVDGAAAWDEWKKNTLAYHAEAYPEVWYGIWSGPDSYNSVLSDYPGQTQFDTALLTGEESDATLKYKGINWTDFPVMNMHAHAWPLFSAVKLLGVEFNPGGLEFAPKLPLEEYSLSSPLLGFAKNRESYEGWYSPLAAGEWQISLQLPEAELRSIAGVVVNGKPVEVKVQEGAVLLSGQGGPEEPLRWKLLKG